MGSVSPSGQLLPYQLYLPVSRSSHNLLTGLSPDWLWCVSNLLPLPRPKDFYELLISCGSLTWSDLICRQECALFTQCIASPQWIHLDRSGLSSRPLSPDPRNDVDAVQAQLDALHEDACRTAKSQCHGL